LPDHPDSGWRSPPGNDGESGSPDHRSAARLGTPVDNDRGLHAMPDANPFTKQYLM